MGSIRIINFYVRKEPNSRMFLMKRLYCLSQHKRADSDGCIVKSLREENERVSNNHDYHVLLQFLVKYNVVQVIHVHVVLQIALCRIHHGLCVEIVIVVQRGETSIVCAVIDGFVRIHKQHTRIIPFAGI